MEFGSIEISSDTDLSLPSDHPATQAVLVKNKSSKTEVYVGLPITSHAKWIGTLYPPKPKNDLLHYAHLFNVLEANSTGYGSPTVSTINKWIKDTPEGFKFCPKIPQNISRSGNLINTLAATEAFCNSVAQLGNRLGISFLQLSENFTSKRIKDLSAYLEAFPRHVPLAVELRHESWFSNASVFNEIFDVMEQNNVSSIITDAPGRRDVLHQRLTTSTAFIRFNGCNLHPTDFERLHDWALRLKNWIEAGIKNVYFFVHTDEKQLNPFLYNYIIEQLNEHCGLQLKKCKFIDENKLRNPD